MVLRLFRFLGVALTFGSASVALAQDINVVGRRDSTAALVRVACDPAVSVDLRAFKQRQLRRRQTYLEQTISAMSADSLANSDSYTPDDRKDFTETLEYLRNDLAEVRAFISGGCSSAPFAKPASVKSAVSDASLTRSASPSSVLQHTETASVSASQSTHAVATPEGSATDLRTLLENPVPKVFVAEAKPQPSPSSPRSNGAPGQDQGSTGSGSDVKQLQQQVQDIHDALLKQDQDFALVLGLGSLVINRHASDYKNDANVIHTTNLGSATPQLLTGVDFRSHVPSLTRRFRKLPLCGTPVSDLPGAPLQKPCGEPWQVRPWSGFVSLKFAPGASQIINGFVIGGTYSITKYLDVLIGFALTPVNEASPGFRVTASQFVANQQKLGLDLNFDPNAMLANRRSAFDGFPVTDVTGKLIYQGNPLSVHYRGGAVFGVSFPIYFRSYFKTPDTGSQSSTAAH